MDFKVAGTNKGVTALQMDIKIEGITREVLAQALQQAKDARFFILGKMAQSVTVAREEMKPYTPRITTIQVPQDKIREVIGSGGKVIRDIVEKSGAKVDIEDSGLCFVMAEDQAAARKALAMISAIIRVIEPGEIITGRVSRIIDSGAIVDLGGGKDGMCHISELEHRRVNVVTDVLNEGDEVTVKVLEVDKERGRIRLSRKALIAREEGQGGGNEGGGREQGDNRERRDSRPPREHREHRSDSPAPAPAENSGGGDEGGDRRPRRPRPPRDRRD
jgi:polyribonucleotide nucleotidyltransferase